MSLASWTTRAHWVRSLTQSGTEQTADNASTVTTELSRVLARSGHKIRVPKRIRLKRLKTEDAPAAGTPMTSPSSSSSAGSIPTGDRPHLQSRLHTPSEMRHGYRFPPQTSTRPTFRPYPPRRPQSSSQSAPTTPLQAVKPRRRSPPSPGHSEICPAVFGVQRPAMPLVAGSQTPHLQQTPHSAGSPSLAKLMVNIPTTPSTSHASESSWKAASSSTPALSSGVVGLPAPTISSALSVGERPSRHFGAVDGPLTLPPILGDGSPQGSSLRTPDSAIFSEAGMRKVARSESSTRMRLDRLLL